MVAGVWERVCKWTYLRCSDAEDARKRCTTTNLLAAFCERTEEDFTPYADMLLQKLLSRFNDHDEVCVAEMRGALKRRLQASIIVASVTMRCMLMGAGVRQGWMARRQCRVREDQ